MIEVLVKRKRIVAFFKKFGLIIKRVVTSSRNRATGEKSFSKSLACFFFFLWIVHLGLLNPTISWYYSKGQKTLEKGLNLLGIYSRELDRR